MACAIGEFDKNKVAGMRSDLLELCGAIRRIIGQEEGPAPLHAPVFWGNEKAYVADAIDSTFVSSVGEYVNRFESMLAQFTGASRAVACVNGTAGLQVALRLVGVSRGSLVLTQALSFVATANAIAHTGAEPVFLDVDDDSLGLSPKALRAFLEQHCRADAQGAFHRATGKRIAACVPMHSFGLPCRMDELASICAEWGIPIVEDAAEALGSRIGSQHCGTFGQLGVLSFNGNKICTTGGGGAILANDEDLANRAKHLTTTAKKAHPWAFEHDEIAWNFRLPNLNAALGCAQLEQLPYFLARKRKRAQDYAQLFEHTPWSFVQEISGTSANYWLCAVLFNSREERDQFLACSNGSGLMTRPPWRPLHSLPMYAHCLRDGLLRTLDFADRIANLPSGLFNKDRPME